MRIHKPPKWDVVQEMVLFTNVEELAVIANALEDATVNWREGSAIQLKVSELLTVITDAMGG
jgi:hypothetical protein